MRLENLVPKTIAVDVSCPHVSSKVGDDISPLPAARRSVWKEPQQPEDEVTEEREMDVACRFSATIMMKDQNQQLRDNRAPPPSSW